MLNKAFTDFKKFRVRPGETVNLKHYQTEFKGKSLTKKWAEDLLEIGRGHLAEVQERLYAQDRYGVLIIFQAMDAGGKDSAIKHIMSGFNPQGVRVHSFKAPTPLELDHHYLWRHSLALPGRGEIAIHNRSHYENVLITRVHPEYILNERLPGVDSLAKINDKFWEHRFAQINQFEKTLSQNGTVILKFFLHLSKEEQKKRFLERIDDPSKHWKFSAGDLKERALWGDYQRAYEKAIGATSKKYAPWFIIPADDKRYTRLAIAAIISEQFENLHISYPKVTKEQKVELEKARELLADERPSARGKTRRKKN
jgi:PPK2 family polyphosphate:nucleotide phosphotransferase